MFVEAKQPVRFMEAWRPSDAPGGREVTCMLAIDAITTITLVRAGDVVVLQDRNVPLPAGSETLLVMEVASHQFGRHTFYRRIEGTVATYNFIREIGGSV